jgi:hypothetical protein
VLWIQVHSEYERNFMLLLNLKYTVFPTVVQTFNSQICLLLNLELSCLYIIHNRYICKYNLHYY